MSPDTLAPSGHGQARKPASRTVTSPPHSPRYRRNREAEYEYRWQAGGLTFCTSYWDLPTSLGANTYLSDFMRRKIREKISDPRKAEILTPRDFPALTKRLCADTGYYETFNQDHVDVVDIKKTPIDRITEFGLEVGGELMEFDVIIFATGFDAVPEPLQCRGARQYGFTHLSHHV